MKLEFVEIENYRAIDALRLPLHPSLTVLHGDNAHGKTSVLNAIVVGLGAVLEELPEVRSVGFRTTDRRASGPMRVSLTTRDGVAWNRRRRTGGGAGNQITPRMKQPRHLRERMAEIARADREGRPVDLPIVAFYDTERAVVDNNLPWRRYFGKDYPRFAALEGALTARANFRDFAEWSTRGKTRSCGSKRSAVTSTTV